MQITVNLVSPRKSNPPSSNSQSPDFPVLPVLPVLPILLFPPSALPQLPLFPRPKKRDQQTHSRNVVRFTTSGSMPPNISSTSSPPAAALLSSISTSPVGVGDGWYSYNLGSWHLISLNIECETQPGGCSNSGTWFAAELEWLKKDLEENHSACTLAYWHQPVFSPTNGIAVPEGPTAVAFWQLLYQYHADLVLNGHDHLYARYRPLDPSGNFDPRKGLREFVVGTGGETLDTVVTTTVTSGTAETNMEDPLGRTNFNALNIENSTGFYWGVMGLTLNRNGYAWDFESALKSPLAGAPSSPTFSDKGIGTCHGSF